MEGSTDELKPPKDDGDFVRFARFARWSVYDPSNCEDKGDKLKPPKADNGDRCDDEFVSLRKNKDTMAQGTYLKRKLPSNHIEDQVIDFSSYNESGLQPLNKKKKKATATEENS